MNKFIRLHNDMSLKTGENKEHRKLVKTKKGWSIIAVTVAFASVSLFTFCLSNPVSADQLNPTLTTKTENIVRTEQNSDTKSTNDNSVNKENISDDNGNYSSSDNNLSTKANIKTDNADQKIQSQQIVDNQHSENKLNNNDNNSLVKTDENSKEDNVKTNTDEHSNNNPSSNSITTPDVSNNYINLSSSYTQNFINQVTPGAIAGWKNYGVLPSVAIAQAIIESNWGRSSLSTEGNNLFGIKGSYNGQSIYLPTLEYINGQAVTVEAAFRKYPNWSASIEDHGAFLKDNSRYSNLIGVRNYVTVANDLHYDGYATDPNYAQKLISCVEYYGLNQIDQQAFNGGSGSTTPTQNPTVTPASGTYTFNQTVNIRTAPSTSAQIVGQYQAGQSVSYNGKVDADGYTWLQYNSYNGKTLYVAEVGGTDSNSGASNTPSVTPAYGTYTFNQPTNIRTAPSTSASIVGQYQAGQSVIYNGIVTNEGFTWLQYTSNSGATLYVAELN